MRTLVLLTVAATPLVGATVGVSVAAQSITAERIARMPQKDRAGWAAYLDRSTKQMQADRAFLAAELKAAGLTEPIIPPNGSNARTAPLNKPAEWYASADARRVADIVVSFQTPAGGWSKNLNLADHERKKGEHFASNNLSHYLTPDDFDNPHDIHWNYVGTLDNDATSNELEFLAKVAAVPDAASLARYRASIIRGIEYLLAAQFPNGSWPQVWPLEGGYHDAITFNDGAVTNTMAMLQTVAAGKDDLAFVPAELRKRAREAVARGIECILATQIVVQGERTVWGQQHDALTLQPVAGRNYEPASPCSSESAGIAVFLMGLPQPSAEVKRSVLAAVAWFRKVAIQGKAYIRGPEGGTLVASDSGHAIWARFYESGANRPIFGDRDKSIHDNVEDLSRERRMGYSWYNGAAQSALDRFAEWAK